LGGCPPGYFLEKGGKEREKKAGSTQRERALAGLQRDGQVGTQASSAQARVAHGPSKNPAAEGNEKVLGGGRNGAGITPRGPLFSRNGLMLKSLPKEVLRWSEGLSWRGENTRRGIGKKKLEEKYSKKRVPALDRRNVTRRGSLAISYCTRSRKKNG